MDLNTSVIRQRMGLPPIKWKAQGRRVGRNEPCPCGSGRKFKLCHLKKVR